MDRRYHGYAVAIQRRAGSAWAGYGARDVSIGRTEVGPHLRKVVGVVVAVVLAGCVETSEVSPGASPAPSASPVPVESPTPAVARHVGAAVCAECHAAEASRWAGSDHDLAMQVATRETVLGDFDDATFTDAGATTRFLRRGEGFFIEAMGRDGEVREYPVRYVFGVRPLQQVLVDIGGGRLQAHPVAWDVETGAWISLYPGEEIPPDDPLHWTRFGLNWNQGCADCHSTNLQKQYDVETDTYETVWSEINVSCEACHGPGERHVAWARNADGSKDADGARGLLLRLGVGAFPDRDRARQQAQIDTCAPCHARRALVHPQDGWGKPFSEFYRPEILREDLYHADGQVLEEVYVYGSFLQSRMFHEGVACTDCHDPHSLELVAEGNALCAQCHTPADYDVPTHTHHEPRSVGAQCVSCHMVETTYMQVDPRRDHGFHIPRPDLTVEIGVPNACSRCHESESPAWARDHVIEWFGTERPDDIHEAAAMAAGRAQAPGSAERLAAVVANPKRSAILRATALHLLPAADLSAASEASRGALGDPEPLVRSFAAANVAALAVTPQDLDVLMPLLRDPSRLVRTDVAASLSRVALDRFSNPESSDARAFRAALEEYRAGQAASADQPSAQMNLGVLAQSLGNAPAARAFYEQARRIEPAFVPARFNLAMLDATEGRPADAERAFREIIRLTPELVAAKYSLGLLLAEDPARLEDSAKWLGEAARAEPENPRYQYNAGLAVQHLGRTAEAEGFLRTAVNLQPDAPEFRNALAIFYVQQARWTEALPQAERLLELVGNQPEAMRFVESIRSRASRSSPSVLPSPR